LGSLSIIVFLLDTRLEGGWGGAAFVSFQQLAEVADGYNALIFMGSGVRAKDDMAVWDHILNAYQALPDFLDVGTFLALL
jgi:hypothetical protein